MNSLKSLFPDREGYVIMLTVLHKTRRSKSSPHHRIRILLRKTRRDFMADE